MQTSRRSSQFRTYTTSLPQLHAPRASEQGSGAFDHIVSLNNLMGNLN